MRGGGEGGGEGGGGEGGGEGGGGKGGGEGGKMQVIAPQSSCVQTDGTCASKLV